jgi:CDGSH-type Zn-finger protein
VEGAASDPTVLASLASIAFYKDGPYVVRGDFEIVGQDGERIDAGRRTVALCRCGKSRIRPFCDGTHRNVGFRAAGMLEDPLPPSRPPAPMRVKTSRYA